MAFEVYKPRGERAERSPQVSLSKSSIVLNSVAREKLNTNKLELAFDKEENLIRIKGVGDGEGGMELRKTKLFAKGFYNSFQIDKRGKFDCLYNADENALYFKIG